MFHLVNIGIITYKRHHGLLRLIESLDKLEEESYFKINNLVIVDNSAGFTTKQIESDIRQSRYPVILEHEPEAGIPFARNRVVKLSEEAAFIAFIDDDETAHPAWLKNLMNCQKEHRCAVVRGPGLPRYKTEPPKWYQINANKKRYSTGTSMFSLATGNALFSMDVLKELPGPFDTRLAQTGGTDSLLGRTLITKGHKIIWCDEALVYEYIPAERQRLRWILQRNFRGGNNYSLQLKILHPGKSTMIKRFFVSSAHIITGLLTMPLLVFRIENRFSPLNKIAEGVGGIAGIFGYRYNEYKRA